MNDDSLIYNLFSLQIEICSVEGAIEYLVKMLNYQAPSGQSIVVENISGILRNVSSIIAIRDDYRYSFFDLSVKLKATCT